MRIDKNLKNTLWWANPHTSGFDGGSLCCAYVSELTTPSTDYRHQCLQHFAHRRAINHACCTSLINSHADTTIYNKEWLVQDSNVIGPRFRRKLTPNSPQAFARFNALGEG